MPTHLFQKGNNLSVGKGRPPGTKHMLPDLQTAIARVLAEEKDGYTALDAIVMKLRQMAVNGDIRAAQLLFDRGYGLITQSINQTHEISQTITHQVDYSKLSDATLRELRSAIIRTEESPHRVIETPSE